MEFGWLIVILVFLIIEGMTTNLVTIWFAFGALCAFISSYFTNNIIIELIVFIVFTILSLIFTKPILDKYIKKDTIKTNIDMIIGKTGIVTEDITPLKCGRVKLQGKSFMAISDKEIKKDKKVEVLKIEGVKVIVKEKER